MKQGSTVLPLIAIATAEIVLARSLDRQVAERSRVAVFLQLPTAARTSALATILDSDEGKNFRRRRASGSLRPYPSGTWSRSGMQSAAGVREAMLYFGSHLSTPRLALS